MIWFEEIARGVESLLEIVGDSTYASIGVDVVYLAVFGGCCFKQGEEVGPGCNIGFDKREVGVFDW